MKRLVLVLLPVGSLFLGCATRIDQFNIGTVAQGQPIPVSVNITPFLTNPQTPEVFTHPAGVPGASYQSEGQLTSGGGGAYSGNLAPRALGVYRARVDVPYRINLFGVTRTASREATFTVDAPQGSFMFDSGGDGWTVIGIFDGGNNARQVSTCPPMNDPVFLTAAANWPEPVTGRRGIALPLGPNCYPLTAAAVTSGFWSIDFLSPDLQNRPGWTGQNAFTYRINSSDALLVPNGLRTQGLLRVRLAGGGEQLIPERRADGTDRTEPVPAGWSRFTFQFAPPANATVVGVVIRVLGVPAVRTADTAVQIDAVTPGAPF